MELIKVGDTIINMDNVSRVERRKNGNAHDRCGVRPQEWGTHVFFNVPDGGGGPNESEMNPVEIVFAGNNGLFLWMYLSGHVHDCTDIPLTPMTE